ncbi:TIGR01440 family protein [Thermoactinomyces sp. DSM 45891]|uniref:TIGR01440 family protein n=1 Tax=Thermoactinomyces sp. DSM 45891 TaxID=1761907 RepID=UPI00091042AB|nr:TIGR01440 family protein [Thermoactinomyces sp. DSM 45891]SFX63098.1 TIGR01440 family protein [Thermoactinomyces sp. DSM 45891]
MTGTIYEQTKQVVQSLIQAFSLHEKHLLVIGVSTSEVIGKQIGMGGSDQVAAEIFSALRELQEEHGFQLAFQCCEHLNRALVMERSTQERYHYPEVSVIPVPNAGGAMASYAFHHFQDSVLVETIQADAAIDIGDTFIGMHLKPVAVPIRPAQRHIGEAHVTMAITRPKLIGGARATYV